MIASLELDEASVTQLSALPPLHRDPFDRMLVCRAMHHQFVVATIDPAVRAYPISVI